MSEKKGGPNNGADIAERTKRIITSDRGHHHEHNSSDFHSAMEFLNANKGPSAPTGISHGEPVFRKRGGVILRDSDTGQVLKYTPPDDYSPEYLQAVADAAGTDISDYIDTDVPTDPRFRGQFSVDSDADTVIRDTERRISPDSYPPTQQQPHGLNEAEEQDTWSDDPTTEQMEPGDCWKSAYQINPPRKKRNYLWAQRLAGMAIFLAILYGTFNVVLYALQNLSLK